MLVASSGKNFEIPKPGLYRGILVDVVDLGLQKIEFKGKEKIVPKVRLVWLLTAKDSEGNNYRVMREVTASMAEQANLFGIVRDIIQDTPKVPFELEDLIGRNNELVISHTVSKKTQKTYANVTAILAPQSTERVPVPSDFVRSKDRAAKTATTAAPATATPASQTAVAAAETEDENIPF